jgi:hypothetical protein
MDDKPKLRVVHNLKALPSRVFAVCCPIDVSKSSQHDETNCPWWINSESHGNCFWRYIRDKSDHDGAMQELVQSELAALLGWSNTKTHFMLKQAMDELSEALETYEAESLLDSEVESEVSDLPNEDDDLSD